VSFGGLTFGGPVDGGGGLSHGRPGISLLFLDLYTEGMFKGRHLSISGCQGICSGAIEGLGFEGSEGGLVEGGGVSDGALFRFHTVVAEESSVGLQDAGLSRIHAFGGPWDDVAINRVIQQHLPSVFAEVVCGCVDPSSEAGVIGVEEWGGAFSSDRVDETGLNDVKLPGVPRLSVLFQPTGGIIHNGGVDGMEVLAASEGDRIQRSLVERDSAVLEATEATAPFVLVAKGVFTFILFEVVGECRGDSGNEANVFDLFRIEAAKIQGGDFLTVGGAETIVTCDEEVSNELEPVGAWEEAVGVRSVMKARLQQGLEAIEGSVVATAVIQVVEVFKGGGTGEGD
jgi:hypothetical protein